MGKVWIVYVLVLFSLISIACAQEGKIKILAIADDGGEVKGQVADLTLEIRPGKGRVFLETFPVTKIDTQISMRFAQQFACSFLDKDCSDLDFIYTIRAGSSIIGGPSAGGPATALTVSMLGDIPLREDVVSTGTINPGGLIGGVGGLLHKIKAASQKNYSIAIIPQGKRQYEENNVTTDLYEYGSKLDIRVQEAASFEELLSIYTGRDFKRPQGDIASDLEYERVMADVAQKICERNGRLRERLEELKPKRKLEVGEADLLVAAEEDLARAKSLLAKGNAYAAASFCFRSNINIAYVNVGLSNQSQDELAKQLITLKKGVFDFSRQVSKKQVASIADLQTSLVVKERLVEANNHLEDSVIGKSDLRYAVAVANERLFSAIAWSSFFSMSSPSYDIDKSIIVAVCEQKIREAEERFQYVSLYLPQEPKGIREDIDDAYEDAKAKNHDLCIVRASKAKADADMVISVIGTKEEALKAVLDQKLLLARQAIVQSQTKGVFPIIGYSYYEYAQALAQDDVVSALRFTQYATELSGLDLYVHPKSSIRVSIDYKALSVFVAGL
ncbi:MAG TPA: S16 family serine protease, partial [Candidatus Nanoarchaeia archaeon]|nr:S16 family serine protease [Candidatus Nanoarchaeia archaeon]